MLPAKAICFRGIALLFKPKKRQKIRWGGSINRQPYSHWKPLGWNPKWWFTILGQIRRQLILTDGKKVFLLYESNRDAFSGWRVWNVSIAGPVSVITAHIFAKKEKKMLLLLPAASPFEVHRYPRGLIHQSISRADWNRNDLDPNLSETWLDQVASPNNVQLGVFCLICKTSFGAEADVNCSSPLTLLETTGFSNEPGTF